MDFSEIFTMYYTLLRGDSEIPAVASEEWNAGIPMFNAAVRAWDRVDGVLWDELWTDTSTDSSGALLIIATGDGDYAAPTNMKFPGGKITLTGPQGQKNYLKIISPNDIQVQADAADYAYFLGNPNSGFTLYIRLSGAAPTSDHNGWTIHYPFYKKPTTVASGETGTTKPEMSDPMFIVHTMLSLRWRPARNTLGYQTADRDAQEALKSMQHRNGMGTWHNEESMDDAGGGTFGS